MSKHDCSSYFKIIKLKDIIRNHNAGVYKKSELYGTGSNIVGVSDLYCHNSIHGQIFRQVPLSKNELTNYTLQEGDLIYGESSLVLDGIAKSLYVTQEGAGTAFAWHTRRYSVNKSYVNSCYLYYFLESVDARRQIMSVATQTALTGITTIDYFNTEINLPSLPIQRKIARILSTADAVIEKTQAAIAKYKAIKQGMLHDLFTRGIDPATNKLRPAYEDAPHLYKESKLGWIPEVWETVDLVEAEIEIIDGDRGVNYPKESDFSDSGYCLFLSATNVTKDGFKFEVKQFISKVKDETLGTGKLHREDIIVTTRGTVGNVAFYEKKVPYKHIRINSGMIIFRNKGNKIQNEFLFYYLKDYHFQILYQKSLSGSAQPQLPIKDLKNILIIHNNEKEQKLLSSRIKCINNKIQTEQSYLHKLQQIKAGLMADLLGGKKKVTVDEEPAN